MKKIRILSIFNTLVFVASFLVSTASQFNIFDSQNIGEVSNKYDTTFAPAGLTFSIWAVIYVSLFAFCFYHLFRAFNDNIKDEANIDLDHIGYAFIVNNLASAFWVFAWLNEQLVLSAALMLVQLITLISINTRIGLYDPDKTVISKIFTQFPLSIYYAWICVATVANLNAALLHNSGLIWPLQDSYWTVILIGIIAFISVFIILIRRNVFFGIVIIWALYGIILKRTSLDPVLFKNIIRAAWTAIGIVALVEVIQMYKNQKYSKTK